MIAINATKQTSQTGSEMYCSANSLFPISPAFMPKAPINYADCADYLYRLERERALIVILCISTPTAIPGRTIKIAYIYHF